MTIGMDKGTSYGTTASGEKGHFENTPEHTLVHEAAGHGGDWTRMGAVAYTKMNSDDSPIGPNDLGLDPSVPKNEVNALGAENQFRAASGDSARRTHYGVLSPVTVTGKKR